MNICVLSKDQRYIELSKLLVDNGYNVLVGTEENLKICDVLILSVALEYDDHEIMRIASSLKEDCIVFSGNLEKMSGLLHKSIIDYSNDCLFLQENAELTAEATLSLLYDKTQKSLKGQRVLVAGYGRIGKALCRILDFFEAEVFVYARREEVRNEIRALGYKSVCLSNLPLCDIVINTVPSVIFTNKIIDEISKDALIVELASSPGGYESKARVKDGGRLPGRILPKSAARVIFDTIIKSFPYEKG